MDERRQDATEEGAAEPSGVEPQAAVDANPGAPRIWSALAVRNFRILWLGEAVSMLGDQAYFVALPWLVLQISGDPLAMGSVLALAGIPRAIFMLLGGALTDRLSPRAIMLLSNALRMVLVTAMAVLVLAGGMQLWMIYGFALLFGLTDAFFWPASSAIVPQLLPTRLLQSGNALVHGTVQITLLLGPVLAGAAIALLGGPSTAVGGETAPSLRGIGLALAFDALTFLFSVIALWMIHVPPRAPARAPDGAATDATAPSRGSVLREMGDGLTTAWRDVSLRTVVLISATINFLVNGPIMIGIPVLADARLPQGAAAFGIIMSAYGGGSLVGTVLAGALPRPSPRRLGPLLLTVISMLGVGLVILAFAQTTWMAASATFAMGVANGYVNILFITWLQTYVPQQFMGRIMSLLMFAGVGLNPVAMILAGALSAWNLTAFLTIAGMLLTAATLWSATLPEVRQLGLRHWGDE